MPQNKKGKAYLVGAGPGDPGLMTLKGKDCLSRAHVVIYDALANRTFLEYAHPDAELIYVGKMGADHSMAQKDINELIIDKAKKGHRVVRLKGGDPFIFGRGGEEALELAKAGLRFEIVPGITSAIAVPAYAGIPLTQREYTSTLAFVTGHEDPTKEKSSIAWDKIATGAGTLVFLMGVGNLGRIANKLIQNGRSPKTAVAVIRSGTVPEQETLVGTLETIGQLARDKGISPPAIIVVGEVVRLRETLNWFETRPLFKKRIVVTRAREQASGFLKRLTELGADCIQFPTIEVVPPETWAPVDRAITAIESYNWAIYTSVNGVKCFLKRMAVLGKDVRDLKGIKIGAIGPKTAEVWHNLGIKPDLMPGEYRAEAVVAELGRWGIEGTRILLPRASKARAILPQELRNMGAHVDVVSVYRTIRPDHDTAKVWEMLEKGAIDMVTFTSSSTVNNFFEMFGTDASKLQTWMASVAVACIGPITQKTAQERGLTVHLVPPEYTVESLTDSIVQYFTHPD